MNHKKNSQILFSDTERIYSEIYDRVAEAHGGKYCWEIKVQLMGRPGKEGNRLAVELMNLPITPEQFYQEQQVHKEELFPLANVLPGIIFYKHSCLLNLLLECFLGYLWV